MVWKPRFRERKTPQRIALPQGTLMGKQQRFSSTGQLKGSTNLVTQSSGLAGLTIERMWDENHQIRKEYREGGPLFYSKVLLPFQTQHIGKISTQGFSVPGLGTDYLEYNGFFANPIWTGDTMTMNQYLAMGNAPSFDPTLVPDPLVWSTIAFDRLRPQIPKGGLAQAIIELREAPSMFKQTFKSAKDLLLSLGGNRDSPVIRPKRIASDYLNHQFGWVPFISDYNKFIDVVVNSKRYIDQLIRDNGLWVRRRRTLFEQTTSTRIALNTFSALCEPNITDLCKPIVVEGNQTSGTYAEIYREDFTKAWAVGSFKYYRQIFDKEIPGFDSSINNVQQLLALHGAEVNPALLYKITPWTWLIDWFTGLGSIIDRANSIATDGIVCNYLYIMQKTVRKLRLNSNFNTYQGLRVVPWERLIWTKQRVEATGPYGFTPPSSLSAKQLSILGALGIDRTFKH
jgi:hypothetical protein